MSASTQAYGANIAFIEELYERYRANPDSVSASWREFFKNEVAELHGSEVAESQPTPGSTPPPPPKPTPVPPLPEQVAMAAYLDEETSKLDALVEKVEEAVERLQEYRTALITAAVTGKIDVRMPIQ